MILSKVNSPRGGQSLLTCNLEKPYAQGGGQCSLLNLKKEVLNNA